MTTGTQGSGLERRLPVEHLLPEPRHAAVLRRQELVARGPDRAGDVQGRPGALCCRSFCRMCLPAKASVCGVSGHRCSVVLISVVALLGLQARGPAVVRPASDTLKPRRSESADLPPGATGFVVAPSSASGGARRVRAAFRIGSRTCTHSVATIVAPMASLTDNRQAIAARRCRSEHVPRCHEVQSSRVTPARGCAGAGSAGRRGPAGLRRPGRRPVLQQCSPQPGLLRAGGRETHQPPVELAGPPGARVAVDSSSVLSQVWTCSRHQLVVKDLQTFDTRTQQLDI